MKKIVTYDQTKPSHIRVGQSAFIHPVDHPDTDNVSNTGVVRTSTVIGITDNGEFETLNTIYIPKDHADGNSA